MEAEEYYYLYNAHGDVTGLIDANGIIAVTYDYDAFGTILSETGSANNNIKYAGYQHDKETGLYYLNTRYYDSTIARFITEDTYRGQANDPLSLNLYSYCHNDPIKYWDPSGHSAYTIKSKNGYELYMEPLMLDATFNALDYFIPASGINYLSRLAMGIKEINMTRSAKKLEEVLENIKEHELTTVSLEIIKDYTYISRALDIPMPKGLKSISKMVGAITRVFNVIDTANIVIDTKNQNYAIEHIVYYHLGDVICSSKREGVEIKYIYAYFEVKKLIDEGKITYRYDDGLYWVKSWNSEKEKLEEKIKELDTL